MARIVQAPNDDDRVVLQSAKVTASRLARRSPLKNITPALKDVPTREQTGFGSVPGESHPTVTSPTLLRSRNGTESTSLNESLAAQPAEAQVPQRMAETLAPSRKPVAVTRSLQRPGFSNTTAEVQKSATPRRPVAQISTASGSSMRTAAPVTTSFPRDAITAKTTKTTASTPLRSMRQTIAAGTMRTPSTALATRSAIRVTATSKTPSDVSRSGGNVNTPTTKSLSSTTMPRPTRLATQTSSPTKPPLPKPTFTTYQRSFSPSKPVPATPALSTSSFSTPKLNTSHIRSQTHLLHHSLLHASAAPTLAAYTSSAHANLLAMHKSLQTLYTQVLVLERQARQAENVLTLHRWAGGNVKSAGRRLNVLCAVLTDVMALTAPGGRMVPMEHGNHDQIEHANDGDGDDAGENLGGPDDREEDAEADLVEEQKGPYAILVADFTAWTVWVQAIWRARDHVSNDNDTGNDTPASPDLVITPSPAGSNPLLRTPDTTITPIDPLGDAPKSSLRSLTHTINALLLRLNDLPAFSASTPSTTLTSSASPTLTPPPTTQATKAIPPTPVHLLTLSLALLTGMQEELQLMREIEFEIVVGEEAWTRQRLGRLAGEVERGFGTPVRSGDGGRW